MRFLPGLLPVAVLAAAAASVSCAATGTDEPPPPGSGGDPGTGGDPTTASGGAGGGQGGEGGEASPCSINCSEIQTDACHEAVCDADQGLCVVQAVEDGLPCDDGEFCTVNDACVEGICLGPDPNDCGMTPDACEGITCDEDAKTCGVETLVDGTPCTPVDLCQIGAECTNGLCLGTPNSCFFAPVPNECHVAVCDPATGDCVPEPGNEGLECIDPMDLCTISKTCAAGVCQGGAPKNCSYLTDGCVLGTCDTITGQCFAQAVMDGDPCDDLDPCTSGELCSMGACAGGVVQMMCVPGDSRCPAGCDETTDGDCVLDVLLMGDDVDQVGWDAYRNALTAAGVLYTEHDLNVLPFPTAAELLSYNTIVWFDESTIIQGDADVQVIADWLDLGNHNLFVSSIDFLWDFENGAPGNGEHNMYLKWGLTYFGDFAGTTISTIDGVPGDPIGGSFAPPNSLLLTSTSDSSGDYANEALGPATHAAHYGLGGGGSGHSVLAHYTTGLYKVVWFGINFHNGLVDPNQRAQLMTNVMSFFAN